MTRRDDYDYTYIASCERDDDNPQRDYHFIVTNWRTRKYESVYVRAWNVADAARYAITIATSRGF